MSYFDSDRELDDILYGDDAGDSRGGRTFSQTEVDRIVRERLNRMKRQVEERDKQFKQLYAIDVDEALRYAQERAGRGEWNVDTALQQAATMFGQPPQQGQPAPQPQVRVPVPGQQPPADDRLSQIEAQQRAIIQRQLDEEEGMDFSNRFPGVVFEQLPPEVVALRRSSPLLPDGRPAISLKQAYLMYLGENAGQQAQQVRQQAARDTLANVQRRNSLVSEGATYNPARGKDVEVLDPVDRMVARDAFGMSDQELLKYRQMAERARQNI